MNILSKALVLKLKQYKKFSENSFIAFFSYCFYVVVNIYSKVVRKRKSFKTYMKYAGR